MHECIQRARQAGASALILHTSALMRAAIRLYQRLGFVRAPELDEEPLPGLASLGFRFDLGRRPG
jgi:ribosomal protein S18 acetylase RimI-like enzyme